MMMDDRPEFGRQYRDEITGFVGRCTGRAVYMTGSREALLTPEVANNTWADGRWISENRLTPTEKRTVGFGADEMEP